MPSSIMLYFSFSPNDEYCICPVFLSFDGFCLLDSAPDWLASQSALLEQWECLTLGEREHFVPPLLQAFYSLPPDDDLHKSQMDPYLPFHAMPLLHRNYAPSPHYSAVLGRQVCQVDSHINYPRFQLHLCGICSILISHLSAQAHLTRTVIEHCWSCCLSLSRKCVWDNVGGLGCECHLWSTWDGGLRPNLSLPGSSPSPPHGLANGGHMARQGHVVWDVRTSARTSQLAVPACQGELVC